MTFVRKSRSLCFVAVCLYSIVYSTPSLAVVILDTGAPDESSNRSVFADPSFGAQFLAQEFTLGQQTTITTIEAYIGGDGGIITMDLSDAIGVGATGANLLGSFALATPVTVPNAGAFVSAAVNQILSAGTYYLTFSGGASGGFMPINAPSVIGTRFIASDGTPFVNVNTAFPIASNFSSTSSQWGIRISGDVPEPTTVLLMGLGLAGLVFARRRRLNA